MDNKYGIKVRESIEVREKELLELYRERDRIAAEMQHMQMLFQKADAEIREKEKELNQEIGLIQSKSI